MEEFNLFNGFFVGIFFLYVASPTDECTPYHSDVVVISWGFDFFIILSMNSEVF